MSDHTGPDNSDMQKRIASKCNNAAWALIEQPDLDAADIARLLTLAATARHHWHEIGDAGNGAHADLLFAWALARAGVAEAACLLADTALSHFENGGAKWEQAFAHAAMAAACRANRDRDGFQDHCARAEALGSELSPQEADYFLAAFKTVREKPGKDGL